MMVIEPITMTATSHSGDSAGGLLIAIGSTPSSRPTIPPHTTTVESDNSSNLRGRAAIPSAAETTTPPTKPGSTPIAGPTHSSSRDPFESIIPISAPTAAHTAAQINPMPIAPEISLSHSFNRHLRSNGARPCRAIAHRCWLLRGDGQTPNHNAHQRDAHPHARSILYLMIPRNRTVIRFDKAVPRPC